jgi:nicotinate-nucleotide adenylyltransferase
MVDLAVAGNPHFAVDRLEVVRQGPTFAVDTLEVLYALTRDAGREPDLWFILSAQALLTMPQWRTPDRVLELARLAVVPRPGVRTLEADWVDAHFPGRGDRVRFLDGPLLDVSSTAVRKRIRAGWSIRYLVPDAVRAYIADHHLYRT